jgi:hypothetical protein
MVHMRQPRASSPGAKPKGRKAKARKAKPASSDEDDSDDQLDVDSSNEHDGVDDDEPKEEAKSESESDSDSDSEDGSRRARKAPARARRAVRVGAGSALALDQLRRQMQAESVSRTASSLGKAEQHRVSSVNAAIEKTLEEAAESQEAAMANALRRQAEAAEKALRAAVERAIRETREAAEEQAAEQRRVHQREIAQLQHDAAKAQERAVRLAVEEANKLAAERQMRAVSDALERARIAAEAEKLAAVQEALERAHAEAMVAQAKAVAAAVAAAVEVERLAGLERQLAAVAKAIAETKEEAARRQQAAVAAAIAETRALALKEQQLAVAAAVAQAQAEAAEYHRRTMALVAKEAVRTTVDHIQQEARKTAEAHASRLVAQMAARVAAAGALQLLPATASFLSAPNPPNSRSNLPSSRATGFKGGLGPAGASSAPALHAPGSVDGSPSAARDEPATTVTTPAASGAIPGRHEPQASELTAHRDGKSAVSNAAIITDGDASSPTSPPVVSSSPTKSLLACDSAATLGDEALAPLIASASRAAELSGARMAGRPMALGRAELSPRMRSHEGSLASVMIAAETERGWAETWAHLRARTVNRVTETVNHGSIGRLLGLPGMVDPPERQMALTNMMYRSRSQSTLYKPSFPSPMLNRRRATTAGRPPHPRTPPPSISVEVKSKALHGEG